jgi:subtilisin family serine protease
VFCFSSAGNNGNKKQNTSSVWEGDFVDGGPVPDLPGEQHVHLYAPNKNGNLVAAGRSQWVGLFWADPRHGSSNQYNLYVIDAKGELKRLGTTSHTGFQPPWQLVDGVEAGDAIVVTKNADAKPLYLRLETSGAALGFSTQGNTRGHSANDGNRVFSVAAVTALDPPEPFTGGLARPVALYSSDGPRRKFFNSDGSPITPGDLLARGGRSFVKPDIAAAARVSTSVPRFQPFEGTSAAAPHAGAVAALVWSYDRSLTADQVSDILRRTALPIDGGPEGGTAGAGVVTAVAALRRVCQQGARLVCPDGSEAVVTSGRPPAITSGTDADTATQMLLK